MISVGIWGRRVLRLRGILRGKRGSSVGIVRHNAGLWNDLLLGRRAILRRRSMGSGVLRVRRGAIRGGRRVVRLLMLLLLHWMVLHGLRRGRNVCRG